MKQDIKNEVSTIMNGSAFDRETSIMNLMYKMETSTKKILRDEQNFDLHLSQDEQIELIDVLIQLAEGFETYYSSLLWIIGKANPLIMIDPVQEFTLKYANRMPDEMLYQTLVALQNCMVSNDFRDYSTLKDKFRCNELLTILQQIEKEDNRLNEMIQDFLSNLVVFCNS